MSRRSRSLRAAQAMSAAAGAALGVYGTYVAITWLRYGHPPRPSRHQADPLLDRFMPVYDVCDRHATYVRAPAATTFATACELDLLQQPVVRAIVRAREVLLGAEPDARARPHGLLAETRALGWGVLAERPDREVVVGAVTRPWEAAVTFRALPPDGFAAFAEPGYVKIVWTLRADPVGSDASIFRTETRAVATDAGARARFRRYWALLSPGIVLIRLVSLAPVRTRAERLFAHAR